jgi:hypothetical protein
MNNPIYRKFSWALAVGLVLIHLSPAAAGILVCIGDGANPDCCEEAPQDPGNSDCECCITVQVVSSKADAACKKISTVASSDPGAVRTADSSPARVAHADSDDPGNPRLSSLRTTVLLI